MKKNWQLNDLDEAIIELALIEDLNKEFTDITCISLFDGNSIEKMAKIISKQDNPVTICGLAVTKSLLARIDPRCQLVTHFCDGDVLEKGRTLLTLHGSAQTLLMVERTLLNFMRHLSGIATLTAEFVKKIEGSTMQILDTRKTTPGMRHLEKFAVLCGGGANHRMGLFDAIMVKDTHIDLMGGVKAVFEKLPLLSHNRWPVIVEVRNEKELKAVLYYGKDKISRVLLDNMTPELLTTCVALCKAESIKTEASGNINLSTIQSIAKTGVDFASIGMLTHSAGHVDLSMKI